MPLRSRSDGFACWRGDDRGGLPFPGRGSVRTPRTEQLSPWIFSSSPVCGSTAPPVPDRHPVPEFASASPLRSRRYTTRPLDVSTWDAFAELVERNNGIFGGCWCVGFHTEYNRREASDHRALKEQLVRAGQAHAAL